MPMPTRRSNDGCAFPLARAALGLGIIAATTSLPWHAMAQTESPPAMTSEDALAAMPDSQSYLLLVLNDGLPPEAVAIIRQMLVDIIGETHFFGSVYAYLPDGSTELSMRIRSGLHSLEAAERLALEDCEAERDAEDSPCRLLATVLPEEWNAATDLSLSSDAAYAFTQGAAEMEKPLFLARSRDTARFTVWSGDAARQSALNECNDLVEAADQEPDCEIVIDDLAAPDPAR